MFGTGGGVFCRDASFGNTQKHFATTLRFVAVLPSAGHPLGEYAYSEYLMPNAKTYR